MKKLFPFLFLVFLISCSDETTQKTNDLETSNKDLPIKKETPKIDSTLEITTEKEVEEEKESIIEKEMPKPVAKKAIIFDELVYDFGTIEEGEEIKHDFNFTNKGNTDLLIYSADVSCGCTKASYSFIPVEGGEKGAIKVSFNGTGRDGAQTQTVKVVSDGIPKEIVLTIKGNVVPKTQNDSL